VAAEHTALRYQNDKLMQYQIGKMTSVLQRDLFSALVCLPFFLSFRHSVLCIFTKGPALSAIPIRNTKRLNFCEQNLQILYQRP
jgi:hypothetical protein